tara:strand:- start:123 stop:386 length:264 start_codon:yes stop_codon:yes gene_type:complete
MSENCEYLPNSYVMEKHLKNEVLPDFHLETRLKLVEKQLSQYEKMFDSQTKQIIRLEENVNDLKQLLSGKSFMRSLSSENSEPGCFQ